MIQFHVFANKCDEAFKISNTVLVACKRKPFTADYIRALSGEQLASEEYTILSFGHHSICPKYIYCKTSYAAMRNKETLTAQYEY